MRRIVAVLYFFLVVGLIFSCKPEKSFELPGPAVGSLKSDATGDCLPKTAVGAFIAGSALTDSNYLEVEVAVATPGTYNIRTDTVNGYSFSGIGSFDHSGANRIQLAASGTPTVAGQDNFTVIFDTSFCFVPVTVLPVGSTDGPAAFTLQGSGDTCMLATVSGNYGQNTQLGAENTVAITINATAPGTYNISTNNMNGFQFSGAGTIASLGQQTITLTASGTPTNQGATVFTVTAGSTTCNFSVNVTASTGQPVTTSDHFPLSANSYWTYNNDNTGNAQDSIVITNKGTVTVTGVPNTYNFFQTADGSGTGQDTTLYRKSGTDYYTYIPVDLYTGGRFDQEQFGDVLFLKEGLKTNDVWTSAEFSGTMNNQPSKLRYQFQCVDANATVPENGITYTNVYKIKCTPQLSVNSNGYENTTEEIDFYYAAGVGLIFEKASLGGTTGLQYSIQHYQVF